AQPLCTRTTFRERYQIEGCISWQRDRANHRVHAGLVECFAHNKLGGNKKMSSSDQSLLRLEGVTKVFLTDEVETHALSGVHLEIERGEFVSINGPSGCGKSTLLSILGLLDSPTDGSYQLGGKSVADLPLAERARILSREVGFIFHILTLIGDLT